MLGQAGRSPCFYLTLPYSPVHSGVHTTFNGDEMYNEAASQASIPTLGDDLIYGAPGIATFMFGNCEPRNLRRIYHLSSEVAPEHRIPIFKIGKRGIAIRKSTLLKYIAKRDALVLASAEEANQKNAVLDIG